MAIDIRATETGVRITALQLLSCASNRRKVVNIDGLTWPEVRRALGLA